MDFTSEMSMSDIERQFDEFDELTVIEGFDNDSLIMRDPEIRKLQAKNRRALEVVEEEGGDGFIDDDDW